MGGWMGGWMDGWMDGRVRCAKIDEVMELIVMDKNGLECIADGRMDACLDAEISNEDNDFLLTLFGGTL